MIICGWDQIVELSCVFFWGGGGGGGVLKNIYIYFLIPYFLLQVELIGVID